MARGAAWKVQGFADSRHVVEVRKGCVKLLGNMDLCSAAQCLSLSYIGVQRIISPAPLMEEMGYPSELRVKVGIPSMSLFER